MVYLLNSNKARASHNGLLQCQKDKAQKSCKQFPKAMEPNKKLF